MKQKTLLAKLYRACINHDVEKIDQLRTAEFVKIAKRRNGGKPFTTRWTVARI